MPAIDKTIIPCDFNALVYLREMSREFPGKRGREEIGRQLALAVGRQQPWNASYVYNLLGGRQPLSKAMMAALWFHSNYGRAIELVAGEQKLPFSP